MAVQQSFLDSEPEQPLPAHCQSRRTDPATSRLAALQHEASGKAGTYRAVMLGEKVDLSCNANK